MDPSLRSSLFNRMMQALELGDKVAVDKIEQLIRNFHPDSPTPISVYIPSAQENFILDASSLLSFGSDSPEMTRSSKPGGSRRRASRVPRGSLLDAQTTVDSDVEDHQRDRLHFSFDRLCSFDYEINVVGEEELRKYKSRFDISNAVTLTLLGDRAAWNPLKNVVTIYGAMLNYGVEVSSDEKKKGFIWGFPTSNKRWKNSWFFIGSEWGRDVPASSHHNLPARKVPRHFTSPEAWSKGIPILLDAEISHLPTAAVLPLDERGRSFLLDEEKMIAQLIFTRLPTRLPRRKFRMLIFDIYYFDYSVNDTWLYFTVCDFDTVCDLQARAVKNSEAISKRHVAGLAKEGIASPDGGDPSDGEKVGDVVGGGVESGQPLVHPKVAASTPAATTPNRKGKEKVGVSRAVSDIFIFDADVPETPLDPASDLTPRTGRGKRPAEGTPDHTARPPKRASRVVQYVVSSENEGADEHVLAGTPPTQTTVPEAPVEGVSAVVSPLPKGVNELNVSTPTPTSVASPPAATGEPNVSSADQPGPSGRPELVDKPGSSKQPGAFASSSGVTREAPPVGPTEVGDGAESVSLSDFTAAEICSYLINNDVYVGEGWEHVKSRSCNRKMKFFFNCQSLMMSEFAENYRRENFLSRDVKRLREQASTLAAEKLSAEESRAQQLT
ncbi:hypothetical protein LWI29_025093 [Acer saccharum]|uniref:Uncharacterized protein n=1 Tax=Acer saccharum TaxID=4024 RepID=A0AA39RIQ9_ACESA|nr:hypothetical protein LWI29_025093 [Acer saccharum]